jgi:hypothetical protein
MLGVEYSSDPHLSQPGRAAGSDEYQNGAPPGAPGAGLPYHFGP